MRDLFSDLILDLNQLAVSREYLEVEIVCLYSHDIDCVLRERRIPLLCPFDIYIHPVFVIVVRQTKCFPQSLQ